MPPLLQKTLRNRWFVVGLHAALWFLLYLAVTGFRGNAPDYREADEVTNPLQSPAPVAGLERLFSSGVWGGTQAGTNTLDPFFTKYFVPPTPPAPTTQNIEVTYQGFYQAGEGLKQTIFRLDGAYVVAPIGAKVAPELFIAEATVQALTLTNLATRTNVVVPLDVKQAIVVPIK